jgi:hypothetical protein
MASTVNKDQRATDLCNEIRLLYAIHPNQTGWTASPFHSRKHIQVGHRGAKTDPALAEEVETLATAIRHLGLAERIGYEVVVVSH